MFLAKRFINQTVEDIPLAPGGVDLPYSSVCMYPGNYMVNFIGYDCTQPGLYKWLIGGTIQCRIVLTSDIYGLMSAYSWHHVHGNADEAISTWQLLSNAGMTHKWRLRCGYITGMLLWLFPQIGIVGRNASVKTLEPLNGFDDGHVMPEVFHEGKWKLWDITNGVYFRKNGVHLSRDEVLSEGVLTCERVPIDGDKNVPGSAHVVGSLDMGSYVDMALRTPEQIDAWYARIFQAPV